MNISEEVELDDGGSSLRLPINVLILFFHLHISHVSSEDGCNVSSCKIKLCSPQCNHRSASACRIETMNFRPQYIHNSHAYPIFCNLLQRNDTGVPGCSVFDYDEEEEPRFTFDVSAESDGLHRLVSIINYARNLKGHDGDELSTNIYFNESESSVPMALQAILKDFTKYFGGLQSVKDWKDLDAALSYQQNPNPMIPPCVTESSYFFQVIWKFQQISLLRVAFLEGNHRHTKYSSLLCNMFLKYELLEDKNDQCYFIRHPNNEFDDEGYIEVMLSKVLIHYNIYTAKFSSTIDDHKVVAAAKKLSLNSQTQASFSVGNEYIHVYVFLFCFVLFFIILFFFG